MKAEEEGKNYNTYDEKTGREIDWKAEVKGHVPWGRSPPRQTQTSKLMKEYLLSDPLLATGDLDIEPILTGQSKYVTYSSLLNVLFVLVLLLSFSISFLPLCFYLSGIF